MNKKLIVANWKCNPATLREAQNLLSATSKAVTTRKDVEVVICPPHIFLANFMGSTVGMKFGVQDIFWEETGAFTGEIGPRMAKSVGATYGIVGHSERRELFGETNEITRQKLNALLSAGLRAILCVGEKSREGDAAEYAAYVKEEVQVGLRGVPKTAMQNVIIAYEPLWAIGSDEADTPERTLEMALYIRKIIADMYDHKLAQQFLVIYGGSVNVHNAHGFLRDGGVDGLLVGRASLEPKTFGKIVEVV